MEIVNIGSRREVCWDEALMDTCEGVRVEMHRPEYRNDALVCDEPWEGNCSGYFVLLPDGGQFRLYYRGSQWDVNEDGTGIGTHHPAMMCVAESKDGKTFKRINAGICAYWGSKENNILLDYIRDNIYFFKDTNPDCPPSSRYKGLAEHEGSNLWLFESADGVHFEKVRLLCDDGAYDSMNVCFWDQGEKQYYLFYRGVHGEGTVDGKWAPGQGNALHNTIIRDVRVRTSKDFITWSEPKMLDYGPEAEEMELYTNQVQKYYRANHMFIGFPTRYIDRYQDEVNFTQLPDWKHRQKLIRFKGRSGTAFTDVAIMTSRDGLHFRRTDEAFMTPGIERGSNWYYGDNYLCYGMAETASDIPGAPNEISMYMGVDYRVKPVTLRRYAIRLDGFFSWRCDYKPGKIITKPLHFDGETLNVNFATSALGFVRIRLLDQNGSPIEGYDSGRLFGDSVDREVIFKKALAELAGKMVRMEITMSDADLYSFRFEHLPKFG